MDVSFIWWGKVDSNHRRHCQQIYSLSHLATLEFPHIQLRWSWWTDSNPRPADYKSAALPAELHQHLNRHCCQPLRSYSAGFRPLCYNSKTGTVCQQLFLQSGVKFRKYIGGVPYLIYLPFCGRMQKHIHAKIQTERSSK